MCSCHSDFEMVIVAESVPVETCRREECKICAKPTWAVSAGIACVTPADSLQGCGRHIEVVRAVLCHLVI
jgi:hypothetical protein